MGGESEGPEDVRQALDRLARLMLYPERFKEDPRSFLEEFGLGAIPDEVVDMLVDMSPDELRLLSRIHYKHGFVPAGPYAAIAF
jgi:hypothetical protein